MKFPNFLAKKRFFFISFHTIHISILFYIIFCMYNLKFLCTQMIKTKDFSVHELVLIYPYLLNSSTHPIPTLPSPPAYLLPTPTFSTHPLFVPTCPPTHTPTLPTLKWTKSSPPFRFLAGGSSTARCFSHCVVETKPFPTLECVLHLTRRPVCVRVHV